MRKVKNGAVLRRIAVRSIRSNKKMNLIVVLSIMLTCILFTALFSIGGSIVIGMQNETMRQVGGSSMAGVKYILPEDYKKITSDGSVKNPVYRIIVGDAVDSQFKRISAEINYAEDSAAKNMFSYPTEGRMPQERNEIAVSTLVLDELGIEHKLGETVPLQIDVDGKIYDETFKLCGYWEGDEVAMAQECWVSRKYCDETAPTPEVSWYDDPAGGYAGYWMLDFDFSGSWDIEGKTVSLLERCGYDPEKIDFGINWAYTTSSVDMETVVGIAVLLLVILTAGYLIIYNVFYINVTANIRSFGLLKTIGTTGIQLKKIVRWQASIYSAVGIPLGFIFGTILSKLLLPLIVDTLNRAPQNITIALSWQIYAAAAIFSLVTIFISCRKPCKAAASVTPIEALRYNEGSAGKNASKKEKKSSRVTPLSMARANLARNKKKMAVVVLSLSLSIILMNAVYSMVRGFDADKFISNSIVGDFAISDVSMTKGASGSYLEFAGVKQDDIDYFSSVDGVRSVSEVYCACSAIKLGSEDYNNVSDFINVHADWFSEDDTADMIISQKELESYVYGVNRAMIDHIEAKEGKIDADKFFGGGYALVTTLYVFSDDDSSEDDFYSPGDKLSLELPDGTIKEYEVMAAAEIPYAVSAKRYPLLGGSVIVPDSEFIAHAEEEGAMYAVLDVDESKIAGTESILQSYTENVNPELGYVSKQTYLDEFEDFISMFKSVGGALSAILALIGILNFINAIVTGIYARKREFAMMQAVGMTGRQLKAMLIWEGVFYAILTALFSVVIGSIINVLAVNTIAEGFFFFTYHFDILPFAVCIPILFILAGSIPYAAYNGICRSSVVERLRESE